MHREIQAGIAGYADGAPAESIVLSGGYPDVIDPGDVIVYTDQGGQVQASGRQFKNQIATRAFTLAAMPTHTPCENRSETAPRLYLRSHEPANARK